MNSITYNANYDRIIDGSLFKEIDELSKESEKFIFQIRLFFLNIKLKFIVNKILRQNKFIIKNIYKTEEYSQLIVLQGNISKILNELEKQASLCNSCKITYPNCKKVFIYTLYNPLSVSFKNVIKEINVCHYIHADKVFNNEDEYKKNNDNLRVFADIWSYESTKEEKDFAFKRNVEINSI